MKFIIERKHLLKPLQQLVNLLNSRMKYPILNNLLVNVTNGLLTLTSTDLEIEIISYVKLLQSHEIGITTIPARKFLNICRELPERSEIYVYSKDNHILIQSGLSRFSLLTLPAIDFPNLDNWQQEVEFTLTQETMKYLIVSTQFSMAHQDVRYYLNGMLLEIKKGKLNAVATDGHRLAICSIPVSTSLPDYSVIVPRKGIIELMRMLDNNENRIIIQINSSNIRVNMGNFILISKLIDGYFPDYRRVLPKKIEKNLKVNRDALKKALHRVAIISNDKIRSIRLYTRKNQLKITAKNLDQEEAEELVDVVYTGTEMEIGFNVSYVIDILNILKCKDVCILLNQSLLSLKIEDIKDQIVIYVVMPMRL